MQSLVFEILLGLCLDINESILDPTGVAVGNRDNYNDEDDEVLARIKESNFYKEIYGYETN